MREREPDRSLGPLILSEADYCEGNEPELGAAADVVITTTDELLFLREPLAARPRGVLVFLSADLSARDFAQHTPCRIQKACAVQTSEVSKASDCQRVRRGFH